MLNFKIILICFIFHGSLVQTHSQFQDGNGGLPWPQPQQILSLTTYYSLDPSKFNFILSGSKCNIIKNAIIRYEKILFNSCTENGTIDEVTNDINYLGELKNIKIEVQGDCNQLPTLDMDEMYTLRVNSPDFPNQGMLFSKSVWGGLRGLETFSQLVYQMNGVWALNSTYILDYPRFSHRGLLLDTSRHFISVPLILTTLDAMAYNKLNVFHWHIVDDPSFPYESKMYPQLSKMGAYRPTHVYSQSDVQKVIEYAKDRGIRVVPEYDTPGHTLSWGKGIPNLLTPCYSSGSPDGTYGPIDPSSNVTFGFIKNLFKELQSVFLDQYLHLGGDEVSFSCWKSNPTISKFMSKLNISGDYAKLESYYMQNVVNIVKQLKKSYLVWEEVFTNGVELETDAVVHVWKSYQWKPIMKEIVTKGYRGVLSSPWYLNLITYGSDWKRYYNVDLKLDTLSEKENKLIIGGEACMWGEYVDGSNVISRTWPRASAVAERLWSPEHVKDINFATMRIIEQRCRMMSRGINVEPITGPGFCDCDYKIVS